MRRVFSIMIFLAVAIWPLPEVSAGETVKDLLDSAEQAAKVKDYESQARSLDILAAEHPDHAKAPWALYTIAELYRTRLDNPTLAADYYGLLVRRYPGNKLSAKCLQIKSKLSRKGHESMALRKARAESLKIVKPGSGDTPKSIVNESNKAAKASDYEGQVRHLERLASGYPDNSLAPWALYTIAETYRARIKNPAMAVEYYGRLMDMYPSYKLSPKALKLSAKLSRSLPAASMYSKGSAGAGGTAIGAGADDGDSVKELLGKANSAAKEKDYRAQVRYLDKIATDHPESKQAPIALYTIAGIYSGELNSAPDAVFYYDQLIEKYPSDMLSKKSVKLRAKLAKQLPQGAPSSQLARSTLPSPAPVKTDTAPPEITITSPLLEGGRAVSSEKNLTVEGVVTDPSGIVEVIFNGREIKVDSRGRFRSEMYLVYGRNDVSVTAMDGKGNRSAREFAISRSGTVDAAARTRDIDTGIPKARKSNSDAIAVVIGNRDYQSAKNVEYAVNDARLIKTYLVDSLGYKVGNIFYYENASKADFEVLFGNRGNHKGKLFNSVKKDRSDVFIYYSGHGAPGLKDRKGYFVPSEADPQYIELSGYPTEVFYENLAKVPARSLTVVLDACFSGASVFENISPMVLEVEEPQAELENAVILSSSAGNQVSSWYNEKEHGMFTYFFLKAIHDRNADADKDKRLTYEEIYNYISNSTEGVPYFARRIHGVEQNPTIQGEFKDRVFMFY